MMKNLFALAFLMVACGGSSSGGVVDEPLPETCNPAPQGFVAWQSPDGLVNVSKKLTGTASGVALQAQVQHVDMLPAVVDFGSEQIEVREDLSLCLL